MNEVIVKPGDLIKNYSVSGSAELYFDIINERSIFFKSDIGRFISRHFNKLIAGLIVKKRDYFIESIIRQIRKQYSDLNFRNVQKFLEEYFSRDHLRKFEYSFLAECLVRQNLKKDIIVDFGGGGSFSTFIPVLLGINFKRLISVDILYKSIKSKYKIEYYPGDCTKTNLKSNAVDVVSIISTLEHIGLGRYGDPFDVNGDVKTMNEAWRILKTGGYLVLTIPYGYPTVIYNLNRVYDKGRFKLISKKFKPVIIKYSLLGKIVPREKIEGKKVSKDIPGYYQDKSILDKHLNPQGGLMALLRKI